MKIIAAIALASALTLGGCSGTSVLKGGTSVTATVANPVSRNDLAVVESAYGSALSVAVNYRRLGICRSGATETLSTPCARRDVLLTLQRYNAKANAAVKSARQFVANNPTLSAVSVIGAARDAVNDFQAALSANGVN